MAVAEAEKVADQPSEVSCLLIPMQGMPLLLPNVSVAEVITGKVLPNEDTPAWHLGTLNWRSVLIPVVSVEILNGREPKLRSHNMRLAIINSYRGDQRLPFYAIPVEGIPGLVRVMPNDLDTKAEPTLPVERLRVSVGDQSVTIPDLDYIEHKILGE
jgi:chemosensory pili system protein ChpC